MDAYEEVRPLGAGGSGRAVVVSPKSGGQKGLLAIKRIACGRDVASANKALFEATTLCTLRHPHVVRFHQVFLETSPGADCSVCIVMEFCAAGDLRQHLVEMRRRDSLLAVLQPEREQVKMLKWMGQLADALEYIHCSGIIHRV